MMGRKLRIAVEGCGHGALDPIYSSIQKACEVEGWDGVDLVIIGGDFQAVRTQQDLNVTAMPAKYRKMGDYHKYYDGTKTAPYLTIFIGGNHEASNHLFELYYGGWVAPNIYYLGAANILQFGPLKIAGLSGIWKGPDYRKPHFERLPYDGGTMRSIYHTRELDVRKLLSYKSQVDIGLSHDWPQGIEWLGDYKALFRAKPYLEDDARSGRLNSVAAREVLDWLRPKHWFSAHHHYKFVATKTFAEEAQDVSKKSEAISAWNKFHIDVQQRELSEAEIHLQTAKIRQAESDQTGQRIVPTYTVEETFKQIRADGTNRKSIKDAKSHQNGSSIPQLDGNDSFLPRKRNRDSSPCADPRRDLQETEQQSIVAGSQVDGAVSSLLKIIDPSAIDVDMSSDDDSNVKALDQEPTTNVRKAEIPIATQSKELDTVSNQQSATSATQDVDSTSNQNGVSSEMRDKLAAMSSTFSTSQQNHPPTKLPHPDTIWNRETNFLALSKCEANKDFLQLMEIDPTNQEAVLTDGPLKLRYDPEWLSILRVFASELTLGGSYHDKGPVHQGDTFYQDRFVEEEKWIQENVVAKGLLDVPKSFEMTTTEPTVTVPNSMPREITHPQTAQFCKLIGIENKFDISEEEREKRMAVGAAQEDMNSQNRDHYGRGGRRGHHDGHGRGGGRGRGRGNRGGRNRW